MHRNELSAFQWTNAIFAGIATLAVMFFMTGPRKMRLLFAGLSSLGPAAWYISWTSSESFCWSLVMMAIVAANRRKWIWAIFISTLAATQNQPIVLLADFFVVMAIRESPRNLLRIAAAGSPLLIPPIYYFIYLRHLSPLFTTGSSSSKYVSIERFFSFFFDLNQGVLPYAPLLLILLFAAVYVIISQKMRHEIGLLFIFLLMVCATLTTVNWNSGANGLMRYAIWILPVSVYIIIRCFSNNRIAQIVMTLQIACFIWILPYRMLPIDDHLYTSDAASIGYEYFPQIYHPVPEVFVERRLHSEPAQPYDNILPVAVLHRDGSVALMLTNAKEISSIDKKFIVSEQYAKELKTRYRALDGIFYVVPKAHSIYPIKTPSRQIMAIRVFPRTI